MIYDINYLLGDANGLDEPEFFRKLQPSVHLNAQNSNLDLDGRRNHAENSKFSSILLF